MPDHLPGGETDHTRRLGKNLLGLMRRKHDRSPGDVFAKNTPVFSGTRRIDMRERFIEDERRAVGGDGAGNRKPRRFAFAEGARLLACGRCEIERCEQFIRSRIGCSDESEMLTHGGLRPETVGLRSPGDSRRPGHGPLGRAFEACQ